MIALNLSIGVAPVAARHGVCRCVHRKKSYNVQKFGKRVDLKWEKLSACDQPQKLAVFSFSGCSVSSGIGFRHVSDCDIAKTVAEFLVALMGLQKKLAGLL